MSDRVRFQIADPQGNTIARTVDCTVLNKLTTTERATLDRVYAQLLDAARASAPHVHEDDLPYLVASWVLRWASDREAYERVCAQKGLLPL